MSFHHRLWAHYGSTALLRFRSSSVSEEASDLYSKSRELISPRSRNLVSGLTVKGTYSFIVCTRDSMHDMSVFKFVVANVHKVVAYIVGTSIALFGSMFDVVPCEVDCTACFLELGFGSHMHNSHHLKWSKLHQCSAERDHNWTVLEGKLVEPACAGRLQRGVDQATS
jgi:hypothetical protein